jgi:hypothetical protein
MILQILLAIVLVTFDKVITALTLIQAEKKYKKRWITLEKNPLARWFFEKLGIFCGSLAYGVISVFTFLLMGYLLSLIFGFYGYVIIAGLYVVAIINNLYWYFKWKK